VKVYKLQRLRAKKILRRCFEQMKYFSGAKTKFKRGMKALLKHRANNIMRKAFVRGLKQEWHAQVYERNIYKASEFACKVRLLKKPFNFFKRRMLARRNAETVA
jgi:hypothetical protein